MKTRRPHEVRIVEVFPRDGLQALDPEEAARLPTPAKIDLVRRIAACGLPEIEAASFARPDRIPALADARNVVEALRSVGDIPFRVLVPNMRGLTRALDAGAPKLAYFLVCSETYQARNVGMSVRENLQEIGRMKAESDAHGLPSTASVGMAFHCPYEGRIAPAVVSNVVGALTEMGFEEITIADTSGTASPDEVSQMCELLTTAHAHLDLGLHLHDAHGVGMVNVMAALDAGVARFECSLLGIGAGIAMNVSQRAMGNISTETAVHLLDLLGIRTGVDFAALRNLSEDLAERLAVSEIPRVVLTGGRTAHEAGKNAGVV